MLNDYRLDLGSTSCKKLSWADRERGFIDFNISASNHCLYQRADSVRIRQIVLLDARKTSRKPLVPAVSAVPGEIRLTAKTTCGTLLSADFGLLMEQAAFFVELRASRVRTDLPVPGWVVAAALDLPAPVVLEAVSDPAVPKDTQIWLSKQDQTGTCSWLAIIAKGPTASDQPNSRVRRAGKFRLALTADPVSGGGTQYFFCWAESPQTVLAKASAMARQDALQGHRDCIATFLDHAVFRTGNRQYDTALAWAAFSGWSLVTLDLGSGIWAGLPWFRDNWGRDSFIAVPGILLVSSRFEEAKAVIRNFAARQNRDPQSGDYGRIPNRWRSPDDVIFNTVDGTLWFIREIWDYYLYTADLPFLQELWPTVRCALEADLSLRTDGDGFLCHGPADTWMDARIAGLNPWSERDDRAVEVQALWYTALGVGSRIADLLQQAETEAPQCKAAWSQAAARVAAAFRTHFWVESKKLLLDRLMPAAASADGLRSADLRLRPNALLALTVPFASGGSPAGTESSGLLNTVEAGQLVAALCSQLLFPHGICSLHQHDPGFHPHHERPEWYHKDAAYHNGTIWGWNSGFTVSALCRTGFGDTAYAQADAQVQQLLHGRCPGSLSENIHAYPDDAGCIVESGTWLQAWSVSEFVRNAWQDFLGLQPVVQENLLLVNAHLPPDWPEIRAKTRFGTAYEISLCIQLQADSSRRWQLRLAETAPAQANSAGLTVRFFGGSAGSATYTDFRMEPGKGLSLLFGSDGLLQKPDSQPLALTEVTGQQEAAEPFPVLETGQGLSFRRLQDRYLALCGGRASSIPQPAAWLQTVREKDYLKRLVLAGEYNAGYGYWLERMYDSAGFNADLPLEEVLGLQYGSDRCTFRVWIPLATAVCLCLYDSADAEEPAHRQAMKTSGSGLWQLELGGQWQAWYYSFEWERAGLLQETVDPYARACGLNGRRGAIIDLSRTDPSGWNDFSPPALASPNDAIVYELHVRDISSRDSWTGDPAWRGKFRGLIQAGLSYSLPGQAAIPVGFDHIRSLGITHLQLLPVFDFVSVDESRTGDSAYCRSAQQGIFNWGYDPGNYNIPEGSYATKPEEPECRIRELKELILACGRSGLGVVMDVVYNHVPEAGASCLEHCAPGYFFRLEGCSGAGSDTASERAMFRKYMVDSLSYWLSEYKLSGFRFDLMGLHDLETMQAVETALRRIKPDVLLYGEGWDMYRSSRPGKSALPMASMLNIDKLGSIGMFNDAFRCGLKGLVFEAGSRGWLQDGSRVEDVAFGLVGAVRHRAVANARVGGTARSIPWTERSASSVNYTEIHDNLTLYDKLCLSLPAATPGELEALQRIALGLILLSQGMPVIHAGMEFLRSKEVPAAWLAAGGIDKCHVHPDGVRQFCHDSYKAGDLLNGLDWQRVGAFQGTVAWLRLLCALRREHPAFRLRTGRDIRRLMRFLRKDDAVLAWKLDGRTGERGYRHLVVAANRSGEIQAFDLPRLKFRCLADSNQPQANYPLAGTTDNGLLQLAPRSMVVLAATD